MVLSDLIYLTDNEDNFFNYEDVTGNMEEFALHNLDDVSEFVDNL